MRVYDYSYLSVMDGETLHGASRNRFSLRVCAAMLGDLVDQATASDIRRWQQYLANERAEEELYRTIAAKKYGEDQEILLRLAEAEKRHQQHWISLLGEHAHAAVRPELSVRILGFMARLFGSLFVLALMQRAETRSPYAVDAAATSQMAADERVHAEVVRALAAKSRARMSGNFRAAVFGANDGLVSNLALVMGVGAAGVSNHVVLLTGISGLLAGALSMAAGEYVSVRSQRELVEASNPDADAEALLTDLDINANELALVFRARGMEQADAEHAATTAINKATSKRAATFLPRHIRTENPEELGTELGAAASSFCFFASGALIPILPYAFGASGLSAVLLAAGMVGIALLLTGGTVGILSGRAPLPRAFRQLGIGFGAAAVTYVLGLAFGSVVG